MLLTEGGVIFVVGATKGGTEKQSVTCSRITDRRKWNHRWAQLLEIQYVIISFYWFLEVTHQWVSELPCSDTWSNQYWNWANHFCRKKRQWEVAVWRAGRRRVYSCCTQTRVFIVDFCEKLNLGVMFFPFFKMCSKLTVDWKRKTDFTCTVSCHMWQKKKNRIRVWLAGVWAGH